MKSSLFVCLVILMVATAALAQIELVSQSYFPADLEFSELKAITSEDSFSDEARVAKLESGKLIAELGFQKYARRLYSLQPSGSLSIEVVTFNDSRAAYSLLTLLRNSAMVDGPPGDASAVSPDSIRFAQGKEFVHIQGQGAPEDLVRRVAISVSNRIGPRTKKAAPPVVAHLPRPGYDSSSVRYFLEPKSFDSYSDNAVKGSMRFTTDMEAAQARYSWNNQTGVLTLLNFPTSQVAEDYFSNFGNSSGENLKLYTKKVGPLIGILSGAFDPQTAEKILGDIQFSYSIRWIYEKRTKPATIWGVPVGILGTVVKSLLFVAVLCGASILLGTGFAFFRLALRRYSKHPADHSNYNEITHLRMR
jgi:hypothetical protein